MMDEAGYDHGFSAGVTAASAILGPIIPPSMNMVIYAVVAGNVSVVALFLGGIGPGVVIGFALMVICYFIAKRRNFPKKTVRVPVKTVVKSFFQMLPALMMPIIIMGGILGGIFTATESAGVAVVYAIVVGLFFLKTITWKDLYKPFVRAAKMTAVVMFVIAVASAMGWSLTVLQIPQKVAQFFLAYAQNKLMFLFMANILLLLIGTVMDLAPALLIMVPVLSPAAMSFGINPIHFGVMVVVNLCIGLITPPVGMTLFVTSNVAKISMSRMYKSILPFMAVEFIALIIITYVPQVTTFIPQLLGY